MNATARQLQVLKAIMHLTEKQGRRPTIREIGKVLNIGTLRGVTVHIDALVKKGYIERGPFGALKVVFGPDRMPVSLKFVDYHGGIYEWPSQKV